MVVIGLANCKNTNWIWDWNLKKIFGKKKPNSGAIFLCSIVLIFLSEISCKKNLRDTPWHEEGYLQQKNNK